MNKRISRELRGLDNLILRYLDRNCGCAKLSKVSCTNLWIIGYIAENIHKDIYQKDIENQFSITRSTASRVIDLMEQKGLVIREKVSHDARLRKLVLTEKALEIATEMDNGDRLLNERLCAGVDKQELEVFFRCIEKMKSNISNN